MVTSSIFVNICAVQSDFHFVKNMTTLFCSIVKLCAAQLTVLMKFVDFEFQTNCTIYLFISILHFFLKRVYCESFTIEIYFFDAMSDLDEIIPNFYFRCIFCK